MPLCDPCDPCGKRKASGDCFYYHDCGEYTSLTVDDSVYGSTTMTWDSATSSFLEGKKTVDWTGAVDCPSVGACSDISIQVEITYSMLVTAPIGEGCGGVSGDLNIFYSCCSNTSTCWKTPCDVSVTVRKSGFTTIPAGLTPTGDPWTCPVCVNHQSETYTIPGGGVSTPMYPSGGTITLTGTGGHWSMSTDPLDCP